jgi:FkbM family methyltransferase
MAAVENWWEVTSTYVGISRPRLPLDVRFRSGMRHRVVEFYDLETLWQIFFRRVYDVRPTDRVIIDAGANIGLFACYAARRSPAAAIICVEPFPATYQRLRETVEANGLGSRITCLNQALHSTEGVAAMSVGNAEASQMNRLVSGGGDYEQVNVHTVSLARLLADAGIGEVDLLKLDVEGSEYDVILTTPREVLQRIRRMNIEYHEPPPGARGGKQELLAHLEASGARVVHHESTGLYGIVHLER